MSAILQQAGAIPFRVTPKGLRVLVITSRETNRWVIPKGNVEPGQTPQDAAVREAYEEAGVRGVVTWPALGRYGYVKRGRAGDDRAATVEVFALSVQSRAKKWPERGQRELAWVAPDIAAELVDEFELKRLFHRLITLHTAT